MFKKPFLLTFFLCFAHFVVAQNKEFELKNWKFSRDKKHWQEVIIPHDWAIAGPFDKKWDLQMVAISQNGETQATEKSGRSGALPWIGEGWYEYALEVKQKNFAHAILCFDGAMSEPIVYVNGKEAGRWAYGYNAFRLDIAPLLRQGANTLLVHLNNREESSRWYPGAGIYRPVKLTFTPQTYIDDWSVFARTTAIHQQKATLMVDFSVVGLSKRATATVEIFDGKKLCAQDSQAIVAHQKDLQFTLTLPNAQLWTPETPHLYNIRIRIKDGKHILASHQLKTGVRTISVTKEKGFQLNGQMRKIQGVCLHHDLGPLGAAVNKAALIRQIKLMKEMGADAIRTAHNMPSQLQMELCDSLGMMVMAESFDMWHYPKCKNGYAIFFDEWAEKDIENLVRNHRNHPSIIMWSIGNEIPEQWSDEGREISERLQSLIHQFDPTRPVTQGKDRAEEALKSGFAQVMDVPGFNYRVYKYGRNIAQLPKGFLLGAETASTVSSRGVYKFPLKWGVVEADQDGQVSSYDLNWCSWSNLPEEDFMAMEDEPYTIGQFIWTGIDYLGEPTPYDEYWPSRSSYFGACDLAGLPKDRYYLYRSIWNKKAHTLHLLPHWTWNGREGQNVPVFCYTDYPEAELFVNGKSQGRRKKNSNVTGETKTGHPATPEEAQKRAERYRLMWKDVVYEPGEIKVVAYDEKGNKAAEKSIRTAGSPARLLLESDRKTISADGNDLAYITVSLTDDKGELIPFANERLHFFVEGAGRFKAVCNGDATSLESFTEPRMQLFNGKLVVTLQSLSQAGDIRLRVTNEKGNISETIVIKSVKRN